MKENTIGHIFENFSGGPQSTYPMERTIHCQRTIPKAKKRRTKIGLFRAANGEWFLDVNAAKRMELGVDQYISGFGQAGDLPVMAE
jgi:hypothetical protein